MKTYVTFGSDHMHKINGHTIDNNCVAVIKSESAERGRELAFDMFGPKFSMEYPEDHFKMESMRFYPRGFIEVN